MATVEISIQDLEHDFKTRLTEIATVNFPMAILPKALPYEPPTDWQMRTAWPHLYWNDELPSPSLQGLEGISFSPFDFSFMDASAQKNFQGAALSEKIYNQMVAGRANFILEDYCHISKDKGYWCRIGDVGMLAHEYIVSDPDEGDIFIPLSVFHLTFGLRFPLHPFFSQILCHFEISLNQILPQATRKIMSFI